MTKCFWFLAALAIFFYSSVSAQSLYVPRNIQASFDRGVRSPDGRPGVHYWQNHGRYEISLQVMPPDRNIRGTEQITYYNDSPDTVASVVFRLVLNFHNAAAVHYEEMGPDRITDGLHIDHFTIDGVSTPWQDPGGHFTWQTVPLPHPLLPGDSVRFSLDWHDQLVLRSGREGMIDSTTYYLAYFYPRVSVYDDYNGWDRLDFTGYQEFYNDFNDYSLQVSVPRNYLVWATGTLENPGEVLTPEYAARLKASMTSDSVIRIVTPEDRGAGKVTAQNAVNTWRWKADGVTRCGGRHQRSL